jgi:hypothetical protein
MVRDRRPIAKAIVHGFALERLPEKDANMSVTLVQTIIGSDLDSVIELLT